MRGKKTLTLCVHIELYQQRKRSLSLVFIFFTFRSSASNFLRDVLPPDAQPIIMNKKAIGYYYVSEERYVIGEVVPSILETPFLKDNEGREKLLSHFDEALTYSDENLTKLRRIGELVSEAIAIEHSLERFDYRKL
jgi:hypothetical protein